MCVNDEDKKNIQKNANILGNVRWIMKKLSIY